MLWPLGGNGTSAGDKDGGVVPPTALGEPHRPAEPQAGLTGRAQGHVGRGHVGGRLEGLDLSRRLAGRAGAHDVHLAHAEAGVGVGVSRMVRAGLRAEARPPLGSPAPAAPLPVVGEGVEVGHLHGVGIGFVGELVNQQPLLSLPDHAHLARETPLDLPIWGPTAGALSPGGF